MINEAYEGLQYAHILFTVGNKDYKRLGKGLLDYDGHGTFSTDHKWKSNKQELRDRIESSFGDIT